MPTCLTTILAFCRRALAMFSAEQRTSLATDTGLDAIEAIPRLYPLMGDRMVEIIEDARREMDVAASFVAVWLIATGFSLAVLAAHGAYVTIAFATYLLACLSYRGCIVAARDYGSTLIWAIDLYRFALIEQLRFDPPTDLAAEQRLNNQVMKLVTGDRYLFGDAADSQLGGPLPPYGLSGRK
jgi:hypothetical protein